MATKTSTVTARVKPEIKMQAEAVLEQLGIPVSVLIDSLYRQIIMTHSYLIVLCIILHENKICSFTVIKVKILKKISTNFKKTLANRGKI